MSNAYSAAAAAVIRLMLALAAVPVMGWAASAGAAPAAGAVVPSSITLDYASYNLLSLVIREQGLLEEEFRADDVQINWVYSTGSNKSMEFLASGSADFGSAAGVACLISFVNGNPIRMLYLINTAAMSIMVPAGSKLQSVAELRGRDVAATPATNPYIFLIRALEQAGLTAGDINLIALQHPDGKNELLRGRVDAWAGLEPLQSQALLQGARYLYTNPEFTTHAVLSVRQAFLEQYPQATARVLAVYDRAREWALAHPEEFVELVARSSRISPEVTRLMLRTDHADVDSDIEQLRPLLRATRGALTAIGILSEDSDLEALLDGLILRERP